MGVPLDWIEGSFKGNGAYKEDIKLRLKGNSREIEEVIDTWEYIFGS